VQERGRHGPGRASSLTTASPGSAVTQRRGREPARRAGSAGRTGGTSPTPPPPWGQPAPAAPGSGGAGPAKAPAPRPPPSCRRLRASRTVSDGRQVPRRVRPRRCRWLDGRADPSPWCRTGQGGPEIPAVTRSTTSAGGPTSTGAAPSDWAAAAHRAAAGCGPPRLLRALRRWAASRRPEQRDPRHICWAERPCLRSAVRVCENVESGSTIYSLTFRRLSDVGQE